MKIRLTLEVEVVDIGDAKAMISMLRQGYPQELNDYPYTVLGFELAPEEP